MRGIKRVMAATGVVFAVLGMIGAGTAGAASAKAPIECATDTDGHTWAWAVCATDLEYRVVVDYCRVGCSREYGPWVRQPNFSQVNLPSGGSIVVQAPQVR